MNRKLSLLMLLCSLTTLCAAQTPQADSASHADVHTIDDVVVTGSRQKTDIRHLPMTLSVVTRQQLEQNGSPSILPALSRQVPGLFVTQRGVAGYGVAAGAAGQMSMRGIGGSPTTRMLVLIDGHPQYMGLMGHPLADAYQTMMAERVEVVRGPASVLYGSNAMGGVINIVTRKMEQDGVKTDLRADYGSYNTFQAEATNRIRKGRFSSVVSANYCRTDGHRKDMQYDQYGGYAKLGYRISKHWKVWGDVNLTHFNAENPGSITSPLLDNIARITRGMTSLAIENDYGRSSGTLGFFYNWGHHKINDGHAPDAAPKEFYFSSRDQMAGISWYQTFSLFKGNRFTAGVDYQHFGGRARNVFTNGQPDKLNIDKSMDEVAGYVDLRQQLLRRLIIDAGIRFDHHSHSGNEWIPQGGLSVLLPRNAQLKFMVSKGFRFPTIREMFMFPPQNSNLKAEKLMNYELSFSQRVAHGKVRYGVNVFFIDGDNMIQVVPVDGRPMNINTGKVENAGVEAEVAWAISPSWQVEANYSYLHLKYPIAAAPEHKLYAGVRFNKGRWTASTNIMYVEELITKVKPLQKENFVLWDARVSFRVTRWMTLYAKGENLLGQHYQINAGFPMPKATALGGMHLNF